MICPKCKTEVSDKDVVCPNCNLRLIFKCPRCGESTRLGSASCKKCGFTFVKFCPKCGSANYASSSVCRKCGREFVNENTQSSETYKHIKFQKVEAGDLKEEKQIHGSLLDRFERQKKQQELNKKADEIKSENPDKMTDSSKTYGSRSQDVTVANKPEQETKVSEPFLFYIDFINLETT